MNSDTAPLKKDSDQKFCFSCSSILHNSALSCPFCGASQPAINPRGQELALKANTELPLNHIFCRGCGQHIHESAISCPKCGAVQVIGYKTRSTSSGKDRLTAAVLAMVLGGLGIHRFYLGDFGLGILYLLFFWTTIPAFVGLIEGIILLASTDQEFIQRYG